MNVVIVPQYAPPDPRAAMAISRDGSPGNYIITFTLSIPGKGDYFEDVNLDQLSGNSLLATPVTEGTLKVRLFSDQVETEVFFLLNKQGRLSQVQIQGQADNLLHAEALAFNMVMPILSRWSFQHDVAVDVAAYQVLEERTGVQKWVLHQLGKEKMLDITERGLSKPEYRTVFAAYREGANSRNPFYQFLCFYKVIEGVRNLRKQHRAATIASGGQYREPPDEKIPSLMDDLHLARVNGELPPFEVQAFTPHLGKKFTRVTDDLREELRNVIAHLEPTKDCLEADKFADIMSCELAVPVIRYICRGMMNNEIKAELNFPSPGEEPTREHNTQTS